VKPGEPQGEAPRAHTAAAMRTRLAPWLYVVAALVYALDRITKIVARHTLEGRPPIKLIPGVLDLSFTTNTGGAFGLFGGASWLFFAATLVVSAIIVYASFSLSGKDSAVGLGLVLGGALGNLTDRLLGGHGLSGKVVDFIHLHHWPVFNLADSAIVVGAVLIVIGTMRRGSRERRA
jgi:signal peptidase II